MCPSRDLGLVTAATSSSPRARIDGWTGAAAAVGVAGALALFAIVMGWRGSDLPAQLFRVELFRRDGFVLWNSQWFSGHPTLDYSVLSPVLGAVTGPIALGACERRDFGAPLRSTGAARVRSIGAVRFGVVRDEHRHEPRRRACHVRARGHVRARRIARPPTTQVPGCRGVRLALPAREPGRGSVPRDRGRGMGIRACSPSASTHGSSRRWESCPCWCSGVVPQPGCAALRAVGPRV